MRVLIDMPGDYPRHIPGPVFLTGATGDFGKAIAARFAALGCPLILAGRTPEKLAALASGFSTPVHTLAFDMRDQDAMKNAIDCLPPAFAQIDILINNAGLALGLDPAQNANWEDWKTMIDVNITGLVQLSHIVLKGMADRKKGHVINIGSTAGTYPYPGANVYGATKAFVKQFSLNLRADLQGTNIRVTNIEPGMVETQFSAVRFKGDREKAAKVYENTTPLTAADVAESVVWAATLPPHVNINRLEIMPTVQSFGVLPVERY